MNTEFNEFCVLIIEITIILLKICFVENRKEWTTEN